MTAQASSRETSWRIKELQTRVYLLTCGMGSSRCTNATGWFKLTFSSGEDGTKASFSTTQVKGEWVRHNKALLLSRKGFSFTT